MLADLGKREEIGKLFAGFDVRTFEHLRHLVEIGLRRELLTANAACIYTSVLTIEHFPFQPVHRPQQEAS